MAVLSSQTVWSERVSEVYYGGLVFVYQYKQIIKTEKYTQFVRIKLTKWINNSVGKRLVYHRSNNKRYQSGKYHYVSSYEIIKYDDHDIELVENSVKKRIAGRSSK